MAHYWLELAIWMLIAYFLGCLLGCLAKKLFATEGEIEPVRPVERTVVAPPAPRAVPPPPPPRPTVPAAPAADKTVIAAPAALLEKPQGIAGPRGGKADNLQRISGIGPKNESILHGLGIYHFDQIASWTPKQVDWVDDHLRFNGRIQREEWIRQARLLADGKEEEFAREYGTGGLRNKQGGQESGERTRRPSSATGSGRMERPKGISGPRGGKADNLQRISGIGPKNEAILHNLGFYHFDQIAAWTTEQVTWVDDHLRFNGRIQREEWIRQAGLLAEGEEDQFAKEYGTGGLRNKQGGAESGTRTRR